jgi:hypothetical protein
LQGISSVNGQGLFQLKTQLKRNKTNQPTSAVPQDPEADNQKPDTDAFVENEGAALMTKKSWYLAMVL